MLSNIIDEKTNSTIVKKELHICYIASQNVVEFIGGIRSFTLSTIRWLRDKNVKVSLVYREKGLVKVVQDFPYSKPEKTQSDIKKGDGSSNSRMFRLPSYFIYLAMQLIFCLLAVISILHINKRQRISVIHAQDTHYGALTAIIAGGLLGIPVITHAHGVMYLFNVDVISRGIQLLTHKLIIKHSKLTISVSEATKHFLITQFGAEPNKVPVLPVGAKVKQFTSNIGKRSKARQSLSIDEKAFVVGYFGRLSIQKNVKSLVLAVTDLVNSTKIENILLLIIGVGEEERNLKALAKRIGAEKHVLFTGYVENLPMAIQAMDVFVLPSFLEGYPTVVLEAKAAGKAIIASNIPGIPEIIENGKTGLLVNPHEIGEIKEAILKLYKDPRLTRELASNALNEASRHDENKIFQQLLQTYETLSSV
jgi:glycosyltransferase involved in cell wall biosynthesis